MPDPDPRPTLDLSGTWRMAPADEELRRRYHEGSFDDGGWQEADVPGHWRSTPAFSRSDGPVLFRRRFDAAIPGEGERSWLVLDGVFYAGDVWLDGTYLGDVEGYFFPHSFDVTELTRSRSEHHLAVEVACSPPAGGAGRPSIAGFGQHWDALDAVEPGTNPGGIWRPVRLERTGSVRISQLRVLCREVDQRAATVSVRAVLDASAARSVELRTTVHAPDGRELLELSREQHLAAGTNRLEWSVPIPDPEIWWPWSLGDQPRYQLDLEVLDDGALSDSAGRRVGLRTVALRSWQLTVNEERFFPKGANLEPARVDFAHEDGAKAGRRVDEARGAGLDLLRVQGRIARPELYDRADEAGMLIWQDLPLQWRLTRSARKQARRQAHQAVDLLAHHPSVAIWGNMATLDRSMARLLARSDGSRPIVTHSGMLPQPPVFDGVGSSRLGRNPGGPVGQLRAFLRAPRLQPGGRLDLEIQAMNHRDISFPDIILNVDLKWRREDGELANRERRAWQGRLPASSCVLAAVVDSVAPADARSLQVDMELVDPGGEVLSTNTYTTALGKPSLTSRLGGASRRR